MPDVDLEAGKLTVRRTLQRVGGKLKCGETETPRSSATIALPQIAVSALYAHRLRQEQEKRLAASAWVETGYVFTTTKGTPVDPRNLLRAFYAVLKRSGLPRLRSHDLRHSAASLLIAQGVHPRMIMELLRHANIATTMDLYGHLLPVRTPPSGGGARRGRENGRNPEPLGCQIECQRKIREGSGRGSE